MNSITIKNLQKVYGKMIEDTGETIQVEYITKVKCLGAFNELDMYDKLKDIQYHKDYPELPICEDGYVKTITVVDLKGVVQTYDKQEHIVIDSIGKIEKNEKYVFFKYDFEEANVGNIYIDGKKHIVKYISYRKVDNSKIVAILVVEKGDV